MFAKNDKGYIPYVENYLMLIATNLTSIYSIYKKKIVKNDIESSGGPLIVVSNASYMNK